MPAAVRRDVLYDNAATLLQDGGIRWDEYWNMPRSQRDRYLAACERKAERERQARG